MSVFPLPKPRSRMLPVPEKNLLSSNEFHFSSSTYFLMLSYYLTSNIISAFILCHWILSHCAISSLYYFAIKLIHYDFYSSIYYISFVVLYSVVLRKCILTYIIIYLSSVPFIYILIVFNLCLSEAFFTTIEYIFCWT